LGQTTHQESHPFSGGDDLIVSGRPLHHFLMQTVSSHLVIQKDLSSSSFVVM
jgi:hypothetical protein